MSDVGCEIAIIKRWGRCVSPTFRTYLWRDEHVLANIDRCVADQTLRRAGADRGVPAHMPRTDING